MPNVSAYEAIPGNREQTLRGIGSSLDAFEVPLKLSDLVLLFGLILSHLLPNVLSIFDLLCRMRKLGLYGNQFRFLRAKEKMNWAARVFQME